MKQKFFLAMNKISKYDKDMEMFLNSYLKFTKETSTLFVGAFKYYKEPNMEDLELEKLLIQFGNENGWTTNNRISFTSIPEISEKYIETKDEFLDLAPKIMNKLDEMLDEINNMDLSFNESISEESKMHIKNLLTFKQQITDLGVDCLLYLSLIRLCFNPFSTMEGYNLVRDRVEMSKDLEVLGGIMTGFDIVEQISKMLSEVAN